MDDADWETLLPQLNPGVIASISEALKRIQNPRAAMMRLHEAVATFTAKLAVLGPALPTMYQDEPPRRMRQRWEKLEVRCS